MVHHGNRCSPLHIPNVVFRTKKQNVEKHCLDWENIAIIDFPWWHVSMFFLYQFNWDIKYTWDISTFFPFAAVVEFFLYQFNWDIKYTWDISTFFPFAAVVEDMSSHQSSHSKQDLGWLSHNNNCRCIFHTPLKLIFHKGISLYLDSGLRKLLQNVSLSGLSICLSSKSSSKL